MTFVVGRQNVSLGDNTCLFAGVTGTVRQAWGMRPYNSGTSSPICFVWSDDLTLSGISVSANDPYVMAFGYEGAGGLMRASYNGTSFSQAPGANLNTGAGVDTALRLGGDPAGGYCSFGEALVFNTFDAVLFEKVPAYLAWKWSKISPPLSTLVNRISSSSNFKNRPPLIGD